jgi:hypothetical protein
MNTEQLIETLTRGAGPAPRAAILRRLTPAAAAGLLASMSLALGLLGAVPREMIETPALWIKLGYAGAMAIAAGWLATRLSRPVARLSAPVEGVVAVLFAMVLVGGMAWLATPAPARVAALLGSSWVGCPWKVPCLSLPALAACLWALRGLAPTRPRATGFTAGLLAGALGALGYSVACPELSAAFVALWYSVGMGLSATLGAVLGAKALRW